MNIQDAHMDETKVELTRDEKWARLKELEIILKTRKLGDAGFGEETAEYYELRKELRGF